MAVGKRYSLIAGIFLTLAQSALADNPCHKGVPVQYAAASLKQAQDLLEIERRYGMQRPQSVRAYQLAQQRLLREYSNKAAYDFGVIGETPCFEFLTGQQWGQQIKVAPIRRPAERAEKWHVFINGKPAMDPSGETVESIFNQVGAFIQSTIYPDNEVISMVINASQTSYPGPCPCPYNTDALGNSCGARSAYSRSGGREPICFAENISREQLVQTRRDMFKATYLFLHTR